MLTFLAHLRTLGELTFEYSGKQFKDSDMHKAFTVRPEKGSIFPLRCNALLDTQKVRPGGKQE